MANDRSAYALKLRDPRWQRKRLEVFNRDGWACTNCLDSKSMLAVHHRTYENGREPWEYNLGNFATLCERCHSLEHELRTDANRLLIARLRRFGFLSEDLTTFADAFRDARFSDRPALVARILGKAITSEEACDALTHYYFMELAR